MSRRINAETPVCTCIGTSNRKYLKALRRISQAALAQGMSKYRQRLGAHSSPILSQYRGAQSERVQEDLGRDLRRSQQLLSQAPATEFGLVSRDNGHVPEGSRGRMPAAHSHQSLVVRAAHRQRGGCSRQGLSGTAQFPKQRMSPTDEQGRNVFSTLLY